MTEGQALWQHGNIVWTGKFSKREQNDKAQYTPATIGCIVCVIEDLV